MLLWNLEVSVRLSIPSHTHCRSKCSPNDNMSLLLFPMSRRLHYTSQKLFHCLLYKFR